MTTPTLADLTARRAAVDRMIAGLEVEHVGAALAVLTTEALAALIVEISALQGKLSPGSLAAVQIGNVVTVLVNVPVALKAEVERLTALANPTPADGAAEVAVGEA